MIEYSGRLKQLLSGKFFALLTNEASFMLVFVVYIHLTDQQGKLNFFYVLYIYF